MFNFTKILPALLLFIFSAAAQKSNLDSLYNRLNVTSDDSLKVMIMNEIGYELGETHLDSALNILHNAGNLSKQIESNFGFALTAYNKSSIYSYTGKLDSASIYALQSLEYFENAKDTSRVFGQSRIIAKIYQLLNQMDEAWAYYQKSYELAVLLDDPQKLGTSLNDLGSYYINNGWLYYDSVDYFFSKAKPYFYEAIEQYNLVDYKRGIAMCYGNLAFISEEMKQFEEAIRNSKRALVYFENLNNKLFMVASYNQIAKIYETMGNYDSSLHYGNKCFELSKEIDSQIDLRNASARIANAYEAKKQYSKALNYQKEYHNYAMSFLNEQNNQALIEVEKKYESEKKASENDLLKKDNIIKESTIRKQRNLIITATTVIALLILLAFITYRTLRLRQKLLAKIHEQKNKIENDKELIQKQKLKLEELDKAKSRFFANISHDLRSPLTLVMGSFKNVLNDKDSYLTQSAEDNLQSGLKNSERIIKLSDEIIDLSILEDGNLVLNKVQVDLVPYIKRLVGMFSSAAQSKEITLNFSSTTSPVLHSEIDPQQFEKIIYNLLSNAIKYTDQYGQVRVDLKQNQNDFIINISDTGSGIPQSSLPYIFDRYYQSPSNRYRSREGLGIGLSLVSELVTLHEGTITCESAVDEGTTFTMTFPLIKSGHSQVVIPEVSERLSKNHLLDQITNGQSNPTSPLGQIDFIHDEKQKVNVLIVEDHPEIRNYINDIITSKYQTILASNGKEALKVMHQKNIDLVITDLMMPWMDGFELMEQMGKEDTLKKIPVLVLSARTDKHDRFQVLNNGVNDFLSKPFNENELLLRIQNLLSQRQNWTQDNHLTTMVDETMKNDLKEDIIKKMEEYIITRIDDPKLSVIDLGREMAASERQVYRLIKNVADMTPFEFIKEVRYQYAHHLIKQKKVRNLSEAAKAIGMSNPSHFKIQYNKRFNNILK